MADCPGSCWFCDYAKGCIPRFHEIPDGHAKLQARLRRKRDPECSTARILAKDIVNKYFGFQPTGRQVDVEITNMTTGKKLQLYGMDEMFVLTSEFMNGVGRFMASETVARITFATLVREMGRSGCRRRIE